MLPLLIELGWKSALIAGVALLADRALRGRPAAERVFVLRAAVILLLALPVAAMLLPAIELPWLPAPEAVAAAVPANVVRAVPAPAPAPASGGIDLAALFYALGAAAVLLHLAIGVAILVRWTQRSAPAADTRWQAALARAAGRMRRPVRLLVSRDIVTPISWGIAPAWILIDPPTLERTGQADAVLAHEVAHIRRFDWPMLVAARIALALCWFNPLVWLLGRTLARRGETAADEAAVRGIERADYAEALLSFAAAPAARAAATGMALWPNALAERIAHIAMHRQQREGRIVAAVTLACVIAAAPPLAVAKLVPAAPGRAGTAQPPQRIASAAARVTPAAAPRSGGAAGPQAVAPEAAVEPTALPSPAAIQPQASQGSDVPLPAPQPVVQAVAVPQNMPQQLRIVGRGGAEVVRGPNGTTIIGAPPEAPAPVAAPSPIAAAADQVPEWAKHAAAGMMGGAADMRNGARNVELTAALPGLDAAERAEILSQVKQMRAQADELERQARALRGPGG